MLWLDVYWRTGASTEASAYSRNSELQVAGARAASSSAVLNNGVISASWPSTGVEKGSRGSRPKSIVVSGLAICTAHPRAGLYLQNNVLAFSRTRELNLNGSFGGHQNLYYAVVPRATILRHA
eukprot:scaffold33934_cov129-Isochrysis_galbana.AAC.1